jgi:hypothetical protein
MPGITVDDDGQIAFNGKKIINLIIHGDDLLGGKYGLATKSISKDMIKSVDVIDHFQPVNALKNKVITDDVAINLILKDPKSFSWSGKADAGIGFNSEYNAGLTILALNETFKTINSFKINNSGDDIENEFKSYQANSQLLDVDNPGPPEIIPNQSITALSLPKQYYFRNKSRLFNLNGLINTGDSVQYRVNFQSFDDHVSLASELRQGFILASDTVHYSQSNTRLARPREYQFAFSAQLNKAQNYFSNSLQFRFRNDENTGLVSTNGNRFEQYQTKKIADFSNDLNWVPRPRGIAIFTIRWYFNYFNTPQRLFYNTGIDSNILNGGISYLGMDQIARVPGLFSNLTASYIIGKPRSHIRQEYEGGVIFEKQQLLSEIYITQNNGTIGKYKGDKGNQLEWLRRKYFFSPKYTYQNKRFKLSVSVPVWRQEISTLDTEYIYSANRAGFYVTPGASLNIYTKAENYFSADYFREIRMGDLSGLNRGLILSDLFSAQSSQAELQQVNSSIANVQYIYKNGLNMLFGRFSVRYKYSWMNSIYSDVITRSIRQTVLVPGNNTQQELSFEGTMSKYFFPVKTKLSISALWYLHRFDQFINLQRSSFTNNSFIANSTLDVKLSSALSFKYNGRIVLGTSRTNAGSPINANSQFLSHDHQMTTLINLSQRITATTQIHYTYQSSTGVQIGNYMFFDESIKYRLLKNRGEVEISLTNLFDEKKYQTTFLDANQFFSKQYELRGRMLLVFFHYYF